MIYARNAVEKEVNIMNKIPSYTKVLSIGSAYTEEALSGEVVIQEKIDGSQFCFGFNEEGEFLMKSKGAIQTKEAHDKMFAEAVKYVSEDELIQKVAPKNTYYYCEYLKVVNHNTLKYNRIPQNHLVLFDVLHEGKWATREELEVSAKNLSIDVIPELFRGVATVDTIKGFLKQESYLGGPILEGVVIKNYNQTILLGGHVFPLFTKYVREEFKEQHKLAWKTKQSKGSIKEYVDAFRNEARFKKAIIHAKEQSLLTHSPKDIGVLLSMIQKDLIEEEEQNIKEHLYKCYKDDILRSSVRGFPEWYKNYLLESLTAKSVSKEDTNKERMLHE